MTLEKPVILNPVEKPAVALALVVALASWRPQASALGLSCLGENAGFSGWVMPSVLQPHNPGQKKSAENPAGPQA
jgi:hypothetical protein